MISPRIGDILVVTLPDGRNALARVFNPAHHGGLHVEWLPAQGEYVRCGYELCGYPVRPVWGTLPPTPDTPQRRGGYEVPGRWVPLASKD